MTRWCACLTCPAEVFSQGLPRQANEVDSDSCPSSDIVRKRLSASSFRPFEPWLNSGQVVRVPQPDFAFMPPKPNEWDLVVYDQDRAFSIIDLAHVAALKEVRPTRGNGKGSVSR